MNTITIPNNLIKEKDLVLIPRLEYERFLNYFEKFSNKENQLWQDAGEKELLKSYSISDEIYDTL